MNNSKKFLIYTISFIIIILTAGMIYQIFNRPKTSNTFVLTNDTSTQNAAKNIFDISTTEKDKISSTSTDGSIVVSVEFPKENADVKNWIEVKVNEFSSSAIVDIEEYNKTKEKDWPDMNYEFDAGYTLSTSSEYIAYVYEIYNYTGGAHGSDTFSPYIINKKTGKKVESLNEIYNQNIYKFLQDYCRSDLKKQFKDTEGLSDMMSDDMFTSGTEGIMDNYSTFWFEGDNIIIHFGQYQIAPYAAGQFNVKVPLTQVEQFKK